MQDIVSNLIKLDEFLGIVLKPKERRLVEEYIEKNYSEFIHYNKISSILKSDNVTNKMKILIVEQTMREEKEKILKIVMDS